MWNKTVDTKGEDVNFYKDDLAAHPTSRMNLRSQAFGHWLWGVNSWLHKYRRRMYNQPLGPRELLGEQSLMKQEK